PSRLPALRPRSRPRTAVDRLPAGCSTSNPWRATASATQPAAWCSSNARSGCAWIRWLSSRISALASCTAPARRRFASVNGSAGRAVGSNGVIALLSWSGRASRVNVRGYGSLGSSFCRQRRLGDGDQCEDEQGDRELERALQPQDDEHGDDDGHPAPPPDRPQPVSPEREPAVPAED